MKKSFKKYTLDYIKNLKEDEYYEAMGDLYYSLNEKLINRINFIWNDAEFDSEDNILRYKTLQLEEIEVFYKDYKNYEKWAEVVRIHYWNVLYSKYTKGNNLAINVCKYTMEDKAKKLLAIFEHFAYKGEPELYMKRARNRYKKVEVDETQEYDNDEADNESVKTGPVLFELDKKFDSAIEDIYERCVKGCYVMTINVFKTYIEKADFSKFMIWNEKKKYYDKSNRTCRIVYELYKMFKDEDWSGEWYDAAAKSINKDKDYIRKKGNAYRDRA